MTIFAKIIAGELPCEKVYEDEEILAFKDINPVAPVHVLIVPKKAYKNLQAVPKEDLPILAKVGEAAQKIAKELGVEEAYRLVSNNGAEVGQSVFHLHFHLIAGRAMSSLG